MAKSFVWYESFYDAVMELEEQDEHLALALAKAIMEYGLFHEYDDSNAVVNAIMAGIEISIDNAQKRYNACVENGKKGGRNQKVPQEVFDEALRAGKSKAEIMKELELSKSSYYRYKEKSNVGKKKQ